MFLTPTLKQSPNQKGSPITYDVMLTFDLDGDSGSERKKVEKYLKDELGFKKTWLDFDSNRTENSIEENYLLPHNTYLSKQFSDRDYVSKKELAVFLKNTLEEVFLGLNGSFSFLIDKAENEEINGCAFEFKK